MAFQFQEMARVQGATADETQLREIGDLFDVIARKDNGMVTREELQLVLPYTAGAAKVDVLALMDEMQSKQLVLNKKQFVRFVAKRAYNSWNAHMEKLENASLAHVIVSMKRRKHLVQFSTFYSSKGVAGAELIVPVETDTHKPVLDKRRAIEIKHKKYHQEPEAPSHKTHSAKEHLHDHSSQKQRKDLVHQFRILKAGQQHVYAIVFNMSTRALEHHVIYTTKASVRIYCARYFCIVLTPSRDIQLVASSAYLGHLYLDRVQACHGPPPDLLMANNFFPSNCLKTEEPMWKNVLHLPQDAKINHLSCAYGNLTFSMAGRLYEWGVGEVFSTPPESKCFFPSLDDLQSLDTSSYHIVPRQFHKAVHEYSMHLSRHLKDSCCEVWNSAKICMGPHELFRGFIPSDMLAIVCSSQSYVSLTRGGDVYVWGRGKLGQLGRGSGVDYIGAPEKLRGFKNPVKVISCGATHVICTDSRGAVLAWGGNMHGQVGTGLTDDVTEPQVLAFLEDKVVIDAAAGDDHSLVLTDAGDVLSFGSNWYGQLGQGNSTLLYSPVPALITFSDEIVDPIYMIRTVGATAAAVSVTGKDESFSFLNDLRVCLSLGTMYRGAVRSCESLRAF
ncbi:hypothetical protein AC1031_009809 [Aphanomyces cochlioides]|nr:hypothetical protein AC1031_009809 [Aphanomyces cochlioides]